jgi:hypothetical protein
MRGDGPCQEAALFFGDNEYSRLTKMALKNAFKAKKRRDILIKKFIISKIQQPRRKNGSEH